MTMIPSILLVSLITMNPYPSSASAIANRTECKDGKEENLASCEVQGEEISINSNDECTLYLAPSSIPNSGFGMYTTIPYKKGSPISENDAPSIINTDINSHQCHKEDYKDVVDWSHSDYVWAADSENMFYESKSSGSVISVMLGSLANSHQGLVNIEEKEDDIYDDSMLHRSIDPGAGAFSYHARTWVASMDIDAGEEIFIDYSDAYFNREKLKHAPRKTDFEQGKKILDEITAFLERKKDAGEKVDDADLSTFKNIVSIYSERTASLFPTTYSSFMEMLTAKPTDQLPWSTVSHPSIEWITQNGICLDNIAMERSTITQAGNGAFARRFIGEGQVVTPAPLLQIMNRDTLKMYKLVEVEDKLVCDENDTEPIGDQLLLNYCFGHVESSLLLCPSSNAIIINHCSDRQDWGGQCGGGKGPNAMYRWATDWDTNTEEWLSLSLEEMQEVSIPFMFRMDVNTKERLCY
uniref:SET domain-containing protein n=1 Tax=Ditylum brightwellii TaxID=49249 RepID=A0A7S4S8D5_9STRA